jgi:hypothetical protein
MFAFAIRAGGRKMSTKDTNMEIVQVPLDRKTAGRLDAFARACGMDPIAAASRLLCDLLADDEFYNAAAEDPPSTH